MSPGVVVSDSGPLHYLILIDCAFALERLFGQVLIPGAVRDELSHVKAPAKVRDWLSEPPAWLEVCAIDHATTVRGIHKGEAAALQLALARNVTSVLMDDLDGREAARRLGLAAIGTVAVLERAAETNLVELPEAIEKIRRTNFFARRELLEGALERDRLRRGGA